MRGTYTDKDLKALIAPTKLDLLKAEISKNIEDTEDVMPTESFAGTALNVKSGYVGVLVSTIRRLANGAIGLLQGSKAPSLVPNFG